MLRLVEDSWTLSNPRLRTHVELDTVAVTAIVQHSCSASPQQWSDAFAASRGRDRTVRGLGAEGLHADHSGFASGAKAPWLSGEKLRELLRLRALLVSSVDEARAKVRTLDGVLDRSSLGTFHQRVGQHLLEERVSAIWRKWHDQKFSADGRALGDALYRDVQEPFFDAYFDARAVAGKRILDFGCGNAYFSAKLAARGANVVGLDNTAELLGIAQVNHGSKRGLELVLTNSFDELLALFASWPAASFDIVYLQDTLLLLLSPEVGERSPQLPRVFEAFRRLLRPSGTLCAMEPNAIFWLASRFGNPQEPYAVVTEYRHPVFNVAPSLDTVLEFLAPAGFALRELRHPEPRRDPSPRTAFISEFPIWDFLVFVPV